MSLKNPEMPSDIVYDFEWTPGLVHNWITSGKMALCHFTIKWSLRRLKSLATQLFVQQFACFQTDFFSQFYVNSLDVLMMCTHSLDLLKVAQSPPFRVIFLWGLNKLDDILQTPFSNAVSWKKIPIVWFEFHLNEFQFDFICLKPKSSHDANLIAQWLATTRQATHSSLRSGQEVIRLDWKRDKWAMVIKL